MKQNATLYVVKRIKNGKKYFNFEVNVTLNNGLVKTISVKPLFAGRKFITLLLCNLDAEE